ncbi:MAG TPA: prepilin-type N-terminal cleavage/methylation domain-containing protein [Candidatus Wallbacteria bacterium]|nr:prepilin-type N-terminal cleavage/methylation domain-containing protein [Candidatus Wallbacteria bacterium]
MKRYDNPEKGFSLIELIVVITIMSILASFAAIYYNNNVNDARHIRAAQDLESIKNAIKMYRVDTRGQYPPSIDALVGKYLATKPLDPWGSPYRLDPVKFEIYCIPKASMPRVSLKYGARQN